MGTWKPKKSVFCPVNGLLPLNRSKIVEPIGERYRVRERGLAHFPIERDNRTPCLLGSKSCLCLKPVAFELDPDQLGFGGRALLNSPPVVGDHALERGHLPLVQLVELRRARS